MAVYKFDYRKEPFVDDKTGKTDAVYRPKVPIIYSFNHKITPAIWTLVDSGADKNLLPASFANYLGIKLNKNKEVFHYGIGGKEVKAYRAEIELLFKGKKFKTHADFSDEQVEPLLGRAGFFRFFKSINFNENKREIELILNSQGN